jgi:hypothetical protein
MMTKDFIYIGVTVYKLIESRRRCRRDVDARDVTYQHNLITERFFPTRSSKLSKPSYLSKIRKRLAELFSGLGIPAAEQPPILAKIMEILPAAYPVVPILVTIVDPTRCMAGSVHDRLHILLDKLQRDSCRERERCKPKPATKSSIENLEKATLLLSCAICWEGLAVASVHESLARLPCSHLYHGDCIARWLEMSHMCPLCRYQMLKGLLANPSKYH